MSPDETRLRQAHAEWIAAVNAGDLACLFSLMTLDALFLSPGQAAQGRAEFPSGFTAAHQRFRLDCQSRLDEIEMDGSLAVARCWDRLSLQPREPSEPAESVTLTGHSLWVYRRQPDGRWLLARAIHNLQPVGS